MTSLRELGPVAAFIDPVLEAGEQQQMHAYVTRLLAAAGDGRAS